VNSAICEVSRGLPSSLNLLHPSRVQLFFSVVCSQLLSICVIPTRRETKFHTHIKQLISGVALGYSLGDRGFESRQRVGIFLFTTATRMTLGPTQPPIRLVPGALSLGVNRPGREADYSPPSSAEVKNVWSYTSIPQIRLDGVVLS
jgi:hypothetical protein